MSQNELYFSQKCEHSKRLINKLIKTPLYHKLTKKCVDNPQILQSLIGKVNGVPAIFLVAERKFIIEDELNQWVERELHQSQQVQPPQQQFQQQMQSQNQRPQVPQPAGIQDFNPLEMGSGLSSMYSSLGEGDNSMFPGCFEFIGNGTTQNITQNANAIATPQGNAGRQQLKSDKLNEDFSMYQTMRDSDVPPVQRTVQGIPDEIQQKFQSGSPM